MWTMPEPKDASPASGHEKDKTNLIAGDCDPIKVSSLALIGPRNELINSFRCYSVNYGSGRNKEAQIIQLQQIYGKLS